MLDMARTSAVDRPVLGLVGMDQQMATRSTKPLSYQDIMERRAEIAAELAELAAAELALVKRSTPAPVSDVVDEAVSEPAPYVAGQSIVD